MQDVGRLSERLSDWPTGLLFRADELSTLSILKTQTLTPVEVEA